MATTDTTNIAILCTIGCSLTLKIFDYFQKKRQNIKLVITETQFRKSSTRIQQQKAEVRRQFKRLLVKEYQDSILRTAWSKLPGRVDNAIWWGLAQKNKFQFRSQVRKFKLPIKYVKTHSSWETRNLLEEHNIAYALLASSQWLIKEPLLFMECTKIINIHPAKLPEHRSLDSLPWSIVTGDKIGATAHFVDAGVDTGPILLFEEIIPRQKENLISLNQRIFEKKPAIFYKTIIGLINGTIKPLPQKESEGIHHRPMTLEELIIAEHVLQERIAHIYEEV